MSPDPAPRPLRSPFLGANPFTPELSDRFFGRDRESAELADQLTVSRVVVVHAASGSGKTSLLQAFLIPHFHARGYHTQTRPLRPSDIAFSSASPGAFEEPIGTALLDTFGISAFAPLGLSPMQVGSLIRDKRREDPSRTPQILIVIDQCEEIFVTRGGNSTAQRAFFEYVMGLSADPSIWLVLSIREDYLARLLAFDRRLAGVLKSRFAVPLFSGETARLIVDASLRASGVTISDTRLRNVAEALMAGSIAASSIGAETASPSNEPHAEPGPSTEPLNEGVVEPLFLQLVAKQWWDACEGSTEALEATPVSTQSVDSALIAYLDLSFAIAANAVAPEPGDGAKTPELVLREDVQQALVDQSLRKQGYLSARVREAADILERRGVLRRAIAHSDRVELAHDQFAPTLVESNRRWLKSLEFGHIEQQYRLWLRQKSDQFLLDKRVVVNLGLDYFRLPRRLRRFARRSFAGSLKVAAGFLVVFAVLGSMAFSAGRELVALKESQQRERDSFQDEALAFATQRVIARAYASVQAQDLNGAAAQALTALATAHTAKRENLDLIGRAESVLARVVAQSPTVDRWQDAVLDRVAVVGLEAAERVQLCAGSSASVLAWQTKTQTPGAGPCPTAPLTLPPPFALPAITVRLLEDRVELSPKPPHPGRTGFSFLEMRFSDGRKVARRLWPTFGTEHLVKYVGPELEFPPLETRTDIKSGTIRYHEGTLYGISLSGGGYAYAWTTTLDDLLRCGNDGAPRPDDENDKCRILKLERPAQLFAGNATGATWGTVDRGTGAPGILLYASSDAHEITRYAWYPGSLRSAWPSTRVFGNHVSPAAHLFHDPTAQRTWLLNADAAPHLLGNAPNEPSNVKLKHRVVWCPDVTCASRTALYVASNGAMGTFDLDDTHVTVLPAELAQKTGASRQHNLLLYDVEPIGGERALGVGTIAGSDRSERTLLALFHRTSEKFSSQVLDARSLLVALDGRQPLALSFSANRIAARGVNGLVALCDVADARIGGCTAVPVTGNARAIALGQRGGAGDAKLLVVGLSDGRIQFFSASGQHLSHAGDAGSATAEIRSAHFGAVTGLLLFRTYDGILRLASGGADGRVKVWLLESEDNALRWAPTPLNLATHAGPVTSFAYTGQHLYSAGGASETYRSRIEPADLVHDVCSRFSIAPVAVTVSKGDTRTFDVATLCPHAFQEPTQ